MADKRIAEIAALRREIDAIDDALVRLLARRAGLAVRIGRRKRALGLPRLSPAREAAILERVTDNRRAPLDETAVERVFKRVFRECRRLAERAGGRRG